MTRNQNQIISSSSGVVAGIEASKECTFEGGRSVPLMGTDVLHLNPRLRFDILDEILALLRGQALVALFEGPLELHIGGWTWSAQNRKPVPHNVALGEWSMAVCLGELVGVEILSRSLAPSDQEQVVRPQRRGVRHRDDAIDDHGPGYSPSGDSGPKGHPLARHIDQDVRETGTNQKQGEDGTRADKGKEVTVIAAPNTVVEPDAVMIERFNTIIADPAVVAARGPPDITGLTVFHGHVHGSHIRGGELDHDPVIGWWAQRQCVI